MNTLFYDIIEENNTLCYAEFCLKIKWNVSAIADSENSNGYIVQRIHYTDTVGASSQIDDYYEAWLVHNGFCDGHSDYDDIFSLDASLSTSPVRQSLGKQGIIRYDAMVYWVDKTSNLYRVVDAWKAYGVPMAGDLKSSFVSDCPVFEGVEPRFTRTFEHKIDCRSDEAVELALRQVYSVRIERKDPNLRAHLLEVLDDSDYSYLIEKICSPA